MMQKIFEYMILQIKIGTLF